MSVMMRNGLQYAGVPDERLENLEEIVGDGQQSVGSDLTDAVTQLNSSLTNLTPLQRGERSVTLNANAQTEFEVVLQRPFTGGSDYAAFVQVEYYGAASYLSAPLIRNKLYDRFVVRIHNNSTAQQTIKILWLVIAY